MAGTGEDGGEGLSLHGDKPVLGDWGEADMENKALLVQSDREPCGEDPIWSGAKAPLTGDKGVIWAVVVGEGEAAGTSMYVGVVVGEIMKRRI